MKETLRVAAVALDSRPGETEDNLAKIDNYTRLATEQGAELVLLPELSLCGFMPNHPTGDHQSWLRQALAESRRLAEPLDGPAVTSLATIAASYGCLVSAGLLEDAGNRLFNTHVLVGPDGALGHWRKMHIPMFETPFYNGGDVPRVIDTPLGRIGANICFDALLPESTRLLAVDNVEIVLFPFAADPPPATLEAWQAWAGPPLRSRCAENGVFGVACNVAGRVECCDARQTFPGGGMILGPRGETLAAWNVESGEAGILITDLRAETLQAARAEPEYLFRSRRPELYGRLAER